MTTVDKPRMVKKNLQSVVYDLALCLLRLQNYCTSTQPDKDSKIDDRQTAKKKINWYMHSPDYLSDKI